MPAATPASIALPPPSRTACAACVARYCPADAMKRWPMIRGCMRIDAASPSRSNAGAFGVVEWRQRCCGRDALAGNFDFEATRIDPCGRISVRSLDPAETDRGAERVTKAARHDAADASARLPHRLVTI